MPHSPSRLHLTCNYGIGATGIYISPRNSKPSMALKLLAPPGQSPDPFYHELLGIAIGAWLTSDDPNFLALTAPLPLDNFDWPASDCTSATRQF
jgi:hypothetical protein